MQYTGFQMKLPLLPALLALSLCAQTPKFRLYNYDESLVGDYTLPNPLIFNDGTPVATPADWTTKRRPEILNLIQSEMFGEVPKHGPDVTFSTPVIDRTAFNGRAIRKQLLMHVGPIKIHILIYTPAAATKPVPTFLGLNFSGNHTVANDPGIDLPNIWVKGVKQPAGSDQRGSQSNQWQVEKILAAGYGLATMYYNEIEPDYIGGLKEGIRPLFYESNQTEPALDEWGAIGAWAWGLSRALDYLEKDPAIDAKHVAVFGHSRLGKAAVWAGASDPRFAMVISNNSGEGGAALSKRNYGETIEHLNVAFPHWFDDNYKKYTNHPEKLPFDSHELLALIAPRPLYVASAEEDKGSDPKGEFLGAYHATPVYKLLGKRGIESDRMPPLYQPIMRDIAFHERAGKHDVTAYDWDQYIAFANQHFQPPTALKAELIFPLEPTHNHSSSIVELPKGDLLVCWFHGSGERTADDVVIQAARFIKSTGQWSKPFLLADTPGFPDTNPTLFLDRDQRLFLLWPVIIANQWETALMKYRISTDYQQPGGPPKWDIQDNILLIPKNIEARTREVFPDNAKLIEKSADKYFARMGWFTRTHPLQLPSGRILVPMYSDGYSYGIMAISDDKGISWTASEPIVCAGCIQPSVVRKNDGTLVAYLRDNGPPPKRAHISYSKDEGQTWTPGKDTDIPNPGSSLEAIRLQNGHWIMVYNDLESGRNSLVAALSEDEGQTWRYRRHLEKSPDPKQQFHYPSVVQSQDGQIHVTYSYFQTEGKAIKHASFPESWLKD